MARSRSFFIHFFHSSLLLFFFFFVRQYKAVVPYASSILCSCHGKTLHAKLDGGGMERRGKNTVLCYDQILSDNCGNKGSICHLNACVKLLRLKKINPTKANQPFPLYLMYFIFRKNSCQNYMSPFLSLLQLLLELWNYHLMLLIKCTACG